MTFMMKFWKTYHPAYFPRRWR